MYKTLDDNFTVRLNWPIIALVGPNGTNKSSVLQALSSAPEGRSLAEFWFSTQVDDIDRGPRGKAGHRFVYSYRFDRSASAPLAECRKYRGSKPYRAADVPAALRGKRDPDYWEPTKRVSGDGMAEIPASGYDEWLSQSRDRWNTVRKDVVYLDFRSELSAFDKYIHHDSFNRWSRDRTEKRYRALLRSRPVARALEGKPPSTKNAAKVLSPVRYAAQPEVDAVAAILGKPIERIALLEHALFGPQGFTVRLYLSGTGTAYSEAHAGSGEYAVVRLVDAISRARPKSLILLDEPEVSLHPAAQQRLMEFVKRQVLVSGHQVVISTHSPTLAATLPEQAIKVFGFEPNRQRVVLVADSCSVTEAFLHLGHTTSVTASPRLIVEDELAIELVKASLRRHAPSKLDAITIVAIPGGADGIVRNALSTFAAVQESKSAILLDGDQRPDTRAASLPEVADVVGSVIWSDSESALLTAWHEQFHKTRPVIASNSDGSGKVEGLRQALIWASKHLEFLPGNGSPEQSLAQAEACEAQPTIQDWKQYWSDRARDERKMTSNERPSSAEILDTQIRALGALPDDSDLLARVYESVRAVISWLRPTRRAAARGSAASRAAAAR